MKYDNMVAANKRRSKRKEDTAIRAIRRMQDDGEEVTVAGLVRATGLSRGFFYNNERVNAELQRAKEKQSTEALSSPKKTIMDKAMSQEITSLKQAVEEKDRIIVDLKVELKKVEKEKDSVMVKKIEDIF